MIKNHYFLLICISLILFSCSTPNEDILQGKVERNYVSVVGKIPGRIAELRVAEGDFVKKGDTLAILDIPETDAKVAQALGAVRSATAQHDMALHGATIGQLNQLRAKHAALKEQYIFAEKSLERVKILVKDSLIPPQEYDEIYAKYQGAKAQFNAVEAELKEAESGVREEQKGMAEGQQKQAEGAYQEAMIAFNERYILAPSDLKITTSTLELGELALPGYTLFKGEIATSTYFRFTVPESKLNHFKEGQKVNVKVRYNDENFEGTIRHIEPLGAYAAISTAYPDFDFQEGLYEITIDPVDKESAKTLFLQSTVLLEL
ncbi:MAG TPA: biotin/lipoyl-binding protein [Flavobacteriaceae bacterium]|nr:biotin/lipoyl-binding protein [Flavobacteriaceae bacterium]